MEGCKFGEIQPLLLCRLVNMTIAAGTFTLNDFLLAITPNNKYHRERHHLTNKNSLENEHSLENYPNFPSTKNLLSPSWAQGMQEQSEILSSSPGPGMVVMATLKDVQRRLPVMSRICSRLAQACLKPYNNRGMWLLPQTSSFLQTHSLHCRTTQESPFQSLLLCPGTQPGKIFAWRLGKNCTSSQHYWSRSILTSRTLWFYLRKTSQK